MLLAESLNVQGGELHQYVLQPTLGPGKCRKELEHQSTASKSRLRMRHKQRPWQPQVVAIMPRNLFRSVVVLNKHQWVVKSLALRRR